jgi:hypothetical protein
MARLELAAKQSVTTEGTEATDSSVASVSSVANRVRS